MKNPHLKILFLKWLPPKHVMKLTLVWFLQATAVIGYVNYTYDGYFMRLFMHWIIVCLLLIVLMIPFDLKSFKIIPSVVRRITLVLILSFVHYFLLCFYVMTILGYKSWSGPFTFELLSAYSGHIDVLLNIYGLSVEAAIIIFLFIWLLIFAGYYYYSGVAAEEFTANENDATQPHSRWPVLVLFLVMIFAIVYSNSYKSWQMSEPLHIAWLNGHGCLRQAPQGIFNKRPLSGEKQSPTSAEPYEGITPRPLVLITVDALRSDQMGVYGAPRETTPFLSHLWRGGKLHRIDNAYSICTTSFCGMIGILSSKYWHQLNEPPVNLADVLKKYNYRNSFLLSGDTTNFFGLRQVLGSHIDLFCDGSIEPKKYANDDRSVLGWLQTYNWKSADRTFLYIHLMSAHIIGLRDPRFKKWLPDKEWDIPKLFYSQRAYQNNYHNGVLQADNTIRQIFEILDREGMLQRALIVITADHGEFLGEFDNFGHGFEPFEPMVRIPMLVYDGLQSNYPERSLSSQVDVAPTMLYAIGAAIPKDWSGIPFQLAAPRKAVYTACYDVSGVVADIGGQRFKFLQKRKGGKEMLFDLDTQKAESINLAAKPDMRKILASMRELNQLTQKSK